MIQTLVTTTTTCLISIDHVAPPHQQLYGIGLLFLLYSACEWAKLIHCGGSCNVTISCALSMFLSERCFGGARGRHTVISPTIFDYYLFANKGDNIQISTLREHQNKMSLIEKVHQPACLGHHEFTLVPHPSGGRMADSQGSSLKASIRIIILSAKVPLLLFIF